MKTGFLHYITSTSAYHTLVIALPLAIVTVFSFGYLGMRSHPVSTTDSAGHGQVVSTNFSTKQTIAAANQYAAEQLLHTLAVTTPSVTTSQNVSAGAPTANAATSSPQIASDLMANLQAASSSSTNQNVNKNTFMLVTTALRQTLKMALSGTTSSSNK